MEKTNILELSGGVLQDTIYWEYVIISIGEVAKQYQYHAELNKKMVY